MNNMVLTGEQMKRLKQFGKGGKYNIKAYYLWDDRNTEKLAELGLITLEERGENTVMGEITEAGKKMLDT